MLKANEWKEIPGWPDYMVSESGEVFSRRRNKKIKAWSDGKRYPLITLSCKGFEKSMKIHRLVAMAFIPNPDNKKAVNHKDGNKQNNHVYNLEWVTFSENQIHAISTGLAKVPVLPSGENHPAAKLTNVDVAMIKCLLKEDFTLDQIAKRFNVHPVHISAIKLNKTWKHMN